MCSHEQNVCEFSNVTSHRNDLLHEHAAFSNSCPNKEIPDNTTKISTSKKKIGTQEVFRTGNMSDRWYVPEGERNTGPI
jgi:hypothetical protein